MEREKPAYRFLQALFHVAVDNSDIGEATSHEYFTEHLSYPHDLPKTEQKVRKRQSILVSANTAEEEAGSKRPATRLTGPRSSAIAWAQGLLILAGAASTAFNVPFPHCFSPCPRGNRVTPGLLPESCSLVNAWQTGFSFLWLRFFIPIAKLESGLESNAKESEKVKPPWVVQSGLWEKPRSTQRGHFQLAPCVPPWLLLATPIQVTGPRGTQIKG